MSFAAPSLIEKAELTSGGGRLWAMHTTVCANSALSMDALWIFLSSCAQCCFGCNLCTMWCGWYLRPTYWQYVGSSWTDCKGPAGGWNWRKLWPSPWRSCGQCLWLHPIHTTPEPAQLASILKCYKCSAMSRHNFAPQPISSMQSKKYQETKEETILSY